MSSEGIDKKLERVAREVAGACEDARGLGNDVNEACESMLRRELLPLLLAGQAIRDAFRSSSYESRLATLQAYDAALHDSAAPKEG